MEELQGKRIKFAQNLDIRLSQLNLIFVNTPDSVENQSALSMPHVIGQFIHLLIVLLLTNSGHLLYTRFDYFLHFRLSMLHQRQALEGLAHERPQVTLRPQECLHELDVLAQSLRHRLVGEGRLENVLKRNHRNFSLCRDKLKNLRWLLELIEVQRRLHALCTDCYGWHKTHIRFSFCALQQLQDVDRLLLI